MSTLGNILSNASQALQAHQKATQVAGHNIGNALTPGYSRQRAEIVTANPLQTPWGTIGGGVRLADITRIRDSLLDVTARRENSAAEGHRLRSDMLGQLEASLVEFGDHGFGATLDTFWDAWGDLANNPGNDAARLMVRTRGEQVAGHLNRIAGGIEEIRQAGVQRLNDSVNNVNRLASNLADINRQIVAAEAGGGTAADLRDTRDRALDELAKITPVQVVERQNGGMGVMVGGITIVDDAVARSLKVQFVENEAHKLQVVSSGSGVQLQDTDGQLGALTALLNEELPGLRGQLDEVARGLVASVNALHRDGVARDPDTGGSITGRDFFHEEFDEDGDSLVNAGNLQLSADVARDPGNIAIGYGTDADPGPGGAYQAGNTEIALAIAQLRDQADAGQLDNKTIGGYYNSIVTGLGSMVASAKSSATVHETLAQQAEIRRESVSGVSTDEEMIKLIQSQTAYQAAAKVITTVDEMLQTVINLV